MRVPKQPRDREMPTLPDNTPTLSVIVPVYNVEHTLDRCIQSILQQEVPDMEVVLVDDGSPDRCPLLCDEWAAKDCRIRVIHQANGGLSAARNAGIEMAGGKYLTFVDSDDYLSPHTYPPLLRFLQTHDEVDLAEYPFSMHGQPSRAAAHAPEATTYADAADYWRQCKAWNHTYAWNKVYRRTLFRDIRFPNGKVFEDIHTIPLLLCKARSIATLSAGCYHYTYNPAGITALADADAYRSLLEAHLRLLKMPAWNVMDDEHYRLALLNIQIYAHEIGGDKPVMPYRPFRRIHTLKTLLYNLLGPRLLCTMNRLMRKIVKRKRKRDIANFPE